MNQGQSRYEAGGKPGSEVLLINDGSQIQAGCHLAASAGLRSENHLMFPTAIAVAELKRRSFGVDPKRIRELLDEFHRREVKQKILGGAGRLWMKIWEMLY